MNKYHLQQLGNTTALMLLSGCIETNTTTCVNISYGTNCIKCLIVSHYNPPFVSPNLEAFMHLLLLTNKRFLT